LVKKGFPNFGITQSGAFVAALKNYNLPDFVLSLVAKDCNSDLLERGRIDDRLSSMNDVALELLHRVFIDCEEDTEGKHAQYRFFAYVSSMYHKCEMLINESRMSKFDIPVGEFLLVIEKTNHKFFTQSSIQHYLCEISTTY